MQSYTKQKAIGTYLVTKSLLQNIEGFLMHDVPEILDCENPNTEAIKISTSIFDSFGEEKLPSIENYKHQLFRDDTKGITVEYELIQDNKEIKITVRFGKEAKSSDLSIYLLDQKAREKVSAIEEGLFDVLNQAKTINWLFHPTEYVAGAILLGALTCGVISLEDKYSNTTKFYMGFIFCLVIIYFGIYQYLKRYSMFDTNKQKHLNTIFNWLIGGTASFIVFSSFATSIRKSILGF